MTLPNSGPLSISQIAAEFDVALPCVFPDAFYGKPGVPGSGTLAISQFYGLSNVVFTPDDDLVYDSAPPGGTASVTLACNVPAVWTFSLPFRVTSSVTSGSSSTSISFFMSSAGIRGFSVSGLASGVSRSFSITLEVEN